MAGDAGDVDDAAGLLRDHDRRDMLHAEKYAAHIDRHDGVVDAHVRVGDADDRLARPGVVDQAVDPAEARDSRGDHRLDVVLLGHVGADEMDADALGQRCALPLAASRGDHLSAFLDEHFGDPFADAAGRAGDDRNLAAQSAHAVLPSVAAGARRARPEDSGMSRGVYGRAAPLKVRPALFHG